MLWLHCPWIYRCTILVANIFLIFIITITVVYIWANAYIKNMSFSNNNYPYTKGKKEKPEYQIKYHITGCVRPNHPQRHLDLKLTSSASCRSDMGELTAIKSCGSPTATVERSDAGFNTVHLFPVLFVSWTEVLTNTGAKSRLNTNSAANYSRINMSQKTKADTDHRQA